MKRRSIMNVAGLLIVGCLLAIIALLMSGTGRNKEHYVSMEDDWKVTINDTQYETVVLESFRFPILKKQDIVKLEHVLPEDTIQNPVLAVYNIHSDVTVYLDGTEIYSYGKDFYDSGELLGYGYQYIDLPDQYAGKTVEIVFRISEYNAFSSIEVPMICNALYVFHDYTMENKVPLVVDIFLIIFGVSVAGATAIYAIRHKNMLRLVWIALFSLCIGCWSLGSYNLTMLFTDNMSVKPWMEFSALYLAPIFILLYFKSQILSDGNRWIKAVYRCLECAMSAFVIIAFLLQILNVAHLPAMLTISHFFTFLLIVLIVLVFIRDIKTKKLEDPTIIIGVLIMGVFASFDLVRFNMMKYTSFFQNNSFNGYTSIGALVLVIALIFDFCNQMSKTVYDAAKNEMLQKIAYTDVLTGLSNRRRCEDIFDKIDQAGTNYLVIEYDLNSLKHANDTYGHDAGDRMLIEFSEVLKEVFSSLGDVCRMGGDEFAVIIEDVSAVDINSLCQQVTNLIKEKNSTGAEYSLSVAYGMSIYAEDKLPSIRKAYKLADERMYENKARMKRGEKV